MIFGYTGLFGSGKTWNAVNLLLQRAEKFQKYIVTNQPLNTARILEYSRQRNWKWVPKLIHYDGIITLKPDGSETYKEKLLEALQTPNSVSLIDECGVWFPSTDARSLPPEFLARLLQSRKAGIDFIWVCQDPDTMDARLLKLAEYITHCESQNLWTTPEGRVQLMYRVECAGHRAYMQWYRKPVGLVTTLLGSANCSISYTICSPKNWGLYDTTETLGTVGEYRPHKLSEVPVIRKHVTMPDSPAARSLYRHSFATSLGKRKAARPLVQPTSLATPPKQKYSRQVPSSSSVIALRSSLTS